MNQEKDISKKAQTNKLFTLNQDRNYITNLGFRMHK